MLSEWGIKYEITTRNSVLETSIENLLIQTKIPYEKNKRILDFEDGMRKKEMDFYIPSLKFGIELHGMEYHSDIYLESDYHLKKSIAAEKQGIRLLQFWGVDITQNPEIVDSIILSNLNFNKKIYARKCEIRTVSNFDAAEFLERNHIQGNSISKYQYGLYYEDDLVSLMTFAKSRFDKNIDWELLRFCNKINTNVVGGASRLLSHFRKGHTGTIISYADRMRSNGNLYKVLGFEFSHHTPPSYYYYKRGGDIESRLKYQKHKLKSVLDIFDPNLTESENMHNNGFFRIWNSGNSVWKLL